MSDSAERGATTTVAASGRTTTSGPTTSGTASENAEPAYRYGAALAAEIEQRWQHRWQERDTYGTPNPTGPLSTGFDEVASKPPFFVMDMFPYPSGTGLHVGHPLGYIGTDVFARYLRMTGFNVLHPFGYDAFGLPAEQFAINTGQHPRVTTDANVANMRRQLSRLGLGHDSRREIATTDVDYYRWTQWIFLRIFNSWYDPDADRARPIAELEAAFASGVRQPVSREANPAGLSWAELSAVDRRRVVDSYRLTFLSEQMVNWCPGLGTVLANEEVTAEGRSDIGNYPVYRRPLEQWMMRITAYAERLIADLDLVDWPDSIKQMQRNWIGPSDGASVEFATAPGTTSAGGGTGHRVEVYTTRPDTLAGATFMVLAPEHPLVDALTADAWPDGTPESWRFTAGATAGTEAAPAGAGAAPADWTPRWAVESYREFAGRRNDRQRGDGEGESEGNGEIARTGVFTGAYVVNPIGGGLLPVFLADYVLMGYGTGAVMAVPAHDQRDFSFARQFGLPIPPVLAPTEGWLAEHGTPGVITDTDSATWPEAFSGEGEYLPAPPGAPSLVGLSKPEAIKTTVGWLEDLGAGRATRSYRLRDWLFSRQRYWGEPFPVVFDDDGLPVGLPDDLLPVTLPEMTDFRPTAVSDDDTSEPVPPLARAKEWTSVTLDLGDGPKTYRRETNTMPQWAGSCWYYLRYLDPTNSERFVDPTVERYWMANPDGPEGGVGLYVGGVEHAVLHLLYSRFWHKVLYDLGLVSTREPFKRLYNQGYIQADAFTDSRGMYVAADEVRRAADGQYVHDGEPVTRRSGKMGKSLKNSVSPDEMCEAYGADTLRVYEMAMGPLDADRPWRTDDVVGSYRFLQRLWRNIVDETTGEPLVADDPLDDEALRVLHRTILAVRADYAGLRFNTAVARLIELTNYVSKRYGRTRTPRELAETMTLMVAPLAPHVAEELWAKLGHETTVVYQPFPEGDESLATESTLTLPVQVNGKVRFTLQVPTDADEAAVLALLTAHEEYARQVGDRTVKRTVVVPGRIVNIALA